MNKVKLNDLIKSGNITVPMYIIKEYSKLDLTLDEFIILIYLYNHNKDIYDPSIIANALNIEIEKVLIGIDSLSNKGLLSIDVSTTSNGVLEEKINLENFYEKITLSLINELNEEQASDNNIFSTIEKELDKKLTPSEQEIIISLQKDYNDDLIKEALKELVNTGNNNVKLLDRILFDWKRQGVKNVEDIHKMKEIEKTQEVFNSPIEWYDDDSEL